MRDHARERVRRAANLSACLALGLSIHAARGAERDCDGVLRMHGLLRNAARVCGFTRYSDAIVEDARSCFEKLGSVQGARDLYAGADEFAGLARARGEAMLCAYLLRQFPMVVRP